MKLEYKILWIDNVNAIYTDHQSTIEEHLTNLGFTPIIEKGADYQAFDKFKSNLKQFDLFLLDYKLDGTQNGNEIIKNIRDEHSIYTDVIFYSTLPDEVRKRIYDDKLNGVYYTSRKFDEFEEDVISIIDVTIKKVQDVNNLRGLIMAEVAELDRMKESILKKYSEKKKCGTIEKYIIEKLKKSYDDNLKDIAKHTSSSLNDIFDKLYVDSDKRARAIKKVETNFDESNYRNNILKIRNKFAHVEECDGFDEKGVACKVIGDIAFTEANCIKIRQEIKKYKKDLEDIEKAI